ncbi:MAG: cohesin domain-containing protein [Candidatus Yanofskybacteria bacterium]|nr:cohesin domain-containing protein [Candidatus Yanofskybacteria bacterium]
MTIRRVGQPAVLVLVIFSFLSLLLFEETYAQEGGGAILLINPRSGSFTEGSTFETSLFIDTGNVNVNAVEVSLKFPADLLQVVDVSTGQSIFSVWNAPPELSNTAGRVTFTGGIIPGINTSNGLISTVKFRVRAPGQAVISFLDTSKVLAEDGKGTNILVASGKATFDLLPSLSGGPAVSSPTHISPNNFYRNDTIVFEWERETEIQDYSYAFSSDPSEVPDNIPDTTANTVQFEAIKSGIWYFHLKQRKGGLWGDASHLQVRIDNIAPRAFKPTVERTASLLDEDFLLLFSTSDELSGIDHYEVAIIDENTSADASPVFYEASSPYRLPESVAQNSKSVTVIVRAIDGAGNIRDENIGIDLPSSWMFFLKANWIWLAIIVVLCMLGLWHMRRRHMHAQQTVTARFGNFTL